MVGPYYDDTIPYSRAAAGVIVLLALVLLLLFLLLLWAGVLQSVYWLECELETPLETSPVRGGGK